jgi:uncharacterized protein (DUF1697 family)
MKTHIAILRGINVSGQKKVIMTELKALFESLGFLSVQTYIQSGNVIFESDKQGLATVINQAITTKYTFDVPVQVVAKEELEFVVKHNPFLSKGKGDEKFLHYTFLKDQPNEELIAVLESQNFEGEEFKITKKVVYLHCPNGYGKAKMNNNFIERKLKVVATTRNLKTVNRLIKLSEK